MKKYLAALGLIVTLAACATEQAPPSSHAEHVLPPKIQLDVQVINLADRSGLQPATSPYNSNRFSPTIVDAIKQWAGDRLQAAGQSGQAIIVIKDASLIAQPLPVETGISGWFTRQQGVKYIARANVSLEANGHQGFAMADAIATRAVTLPENPTAIEKQDAYYSLLNGLMKDLGQNFETGIQMHMGSFILSQQSLGSTAVPTTDPFTGETEQPVVIQSPTSAPSLASAVAAATMPATNMAVTPPTMTISQAPSAADPLQAGGPLTSYGGTPLATITSASLPAPSQGQTFGSTAVPTVPDLGSSPSSFPPQTLPPQAAATQTMPPAGMPMAISTSSSQNCAPAVMAAAEPMPPSYSSTYAPPQQQMAPATRSSPPVTVQLTGPMPLYQQ